jgi:aspartate/methionine/tyrosine aminotransferase
MDAVQSPIIPIIADLIASHQGTISLGQGVVSYGPPPSALAALSSFPSTPADHRYGPVEGTAALRAAITRKLAAENGISLEASRVVVTAGSNMAFAHAVLAVTEPGDEVILPTPYYFNHDMAVGIAGCRTVRVPTDVAYQLQPDAIRAAITPRTRALVTISPNNPTGAVYPETALREVNALCRHHGLYHVHDEAYEHFTYDHARRFSPGSIEGASPHTISLFSLSKTYGMASWRVGYMVIPETLSDAIAKIQDTLLICPPLVAQHVAVAALERGAGYCRAQVTALTDVRRTVLAAFEQIADICTVPTPLGAFYCFARVRIDLDPLELATRLITEHRVAVVPGTAFGLDRGCFLRVSYGALDRDTVAEGMSRLVRGIRRTVMKS